MHGRPATDLHSGPTLEVAVEMKCEGTTLQGGNMNSPYERGAPTFCPHLSRIYRLSYNPSL